MGTPMDRNNKLYAGEPKNTFKEAFPKVKTIKFEYTEKANKFQKNPYVLTENNMRGLLRCSNPLCKKGGFELDTLLSIEVFHHKKKYQEGIETCAGHESMGRWKTRPCFNYIDYKVDVEYNE